MRQRGIQKSTEDGSIGAYTLDGSRVALEIDPSIYSSEALLGTAYKFTERCYVFLTRLQGKTEAFCAILTPKEPGADLNRLVGEFSNELIDQQLRVRLDDRFGVIRAVVVAQAFSEGNLLDQDRESADFREDPKGISRRR